MSSDKRSLAGPAGALLIVLAPAAFAQPPSPAEPAEVAPPTTFDLPEDITLTNASKDSKRVPEPNRASGARALGAAAYGSLEALQAGEKAAREAGEDATMESLFTASLQGVLSQLGPQATASRIPAGSSLAITGEIWLPNGGYSPRVTSYAGDGGFNNAIDFAPGGPGLYGSVTTYEVNGDMVTIHKAMQIGDQSVMIPALTVRSGETAVVQVPGGSVMRVSPVVTRTP